MALSINTNIAAMNSYRNLSATQNDLSSSLEKLSSGFRINRAADDAAGLAISEGLRAQTGGLAVAVRNAQDGISVVQTAEGALTETHAILQRMRDLSVQAANTGGLSDEAKSNIQSEISELNAELDRIAETTTFNGTELLDGSYSGTFQVGANVGETIDVTVGQGMGAAGLSLSDIDVSAPVAVGDFYTTVDDLTAATIDGWEGPLVVNGTDVDISDVTDGADLAAAINAQTDVSASWNGTDLALIADADITVSDSAGTPVEIVAASSATEVTDSDTFATALTDLEGFASARGAEAAIDAIDTAIGDVSEVRADLGAKQNRLDHTINSLNVSLENLSASESRIRDTDMANEMMNFTRAQILSQAGTAMLAQANQIPQGVLQLLQ